MRTYFVVLVLLVICITAGAQDNSTSMSPSAAAAPSEAPAQTKSADAKAAGDSVVIPKGAKFFVASMPDKFDEFLRSAIAKKNVPVTLVDKRELAEFEITGFSETQKASAAKIIIMGSWHSRESASIKVTNLQSGIVAYAYSYNTDNSARGKKSSSEACAKHLKEKIESGR